MSDDVNKSNNIMSLPTVLNPNNPFYSDCLSADNSYFSDFHSMSDYDEDSFSRHFISNFDRRNSIHNLSNYAMQYTLLHPPVQETLKLSKQELSKSVPQKNPFSNDNNFVQDLKIKQDDEQIEPIVVVENSNDPLFPEIKFNSKLLAIFSIPEQMAMLKKVLDEAKLKKQEALDKKVDPWIKLSNQTNSSKSKYITINKNPTKSPDNFRFVQSSQIRAPKIKGKVEETKDSSSDSDFPDSTDPERIFKIRKMLHKIFFKGGKLPKPRSNLIEPDFQKLALETIYSKYDDFLSKYKKSTEEQKKFKK